MATIASPVGAPNQRSSPISIRAFLFDVDGVIADTARLHEAAWRSLAQREDLQFDDQTAAALRGLSREASLRRILAGREVPPERFEWMMQQKNAEYVALVAQLTPLDAMPGVVELIKSLCRIGLKTAAVSASRNARLVLHRLGVESLFDAIIDAQDESAAPTGPHRFLIAAAALRSEPGHCVVVEDSATGVAAARQLGMRCIGIGLREQLCAATMVLKSFADIDSNGLLTELRNWSQMSS